MSEQLTFDTAAWMAVPIGVGLVAFDDGVVGVGVGVVPDDGGDGVGVV